MWEGLRGERCIYILISKNSKKINLKKFKNRGYYRVTYSPVYTLMNVLDFITSSLKELSPFNFLQANKTQSQEPKQ